MANPNYWYPRHYKDYAEKTAHLSMIEHGAYTLLLDHYYQTRGKLMANATALLRVCRCQTDEERAAVLSVLDQFFTVGDDGMYRNNRADKEMGIAANVSAARSQAGKAGAEKRWNNGKEMASDIANGMANAMANPKQTEWQIDAQPQPHKLTTLSDNSDAAQILDYLNEKTGRSYKPVKANISLIAARLKEGATPEECRAVIDAKAKSWLTDTKMAQYLRPATLFAATNYAQYSGELSSATPLTDNGRDWE